MSRPPGDPDDDSAAPAETAPWAPVAAARGSTPPPVPADDSGVVPIPIDLPTVLADDDASAAAADDELFAREALAAADAGNGHAEILMCARALRAEARGELAAALPLWRAAFARGPTLLVAYWGVRRALGRTGAWADVVGVVERRIEALLPRGDAAASMRADLWFERARVEEDRLQRDDEAMRSLRAGLAEAPEHAGLLLSLLLLGFRRADAGATIQALTGLLRRPLPPELRARTTARLAGLERRTTPEGTTPEGTSPQGTSPVDDRRRAVNPAAARALSTLQTALGAVGDEHAAPLLDELQRLARGTEAPATRAAILGEIIAHAGAAGSRAEGGGGETERLVALLRERARLLRDDLGEPAAAISVLRDAVGRLPGHPLAFTELADLLEAGGGGDGAARSDGGADAEDAVVRDLQDLLSSVSQEAKAPPGDAERELALRVATALAGRGRTAEALTILEQLGEGADQRPDVFALATLVRATGGDGDGAGADLTAAYEGLAERLLNGAAADAGGLGAAASGASHALLIAGTVAEIKAAKIAGSRVGSDTADDVALRLYRRAAEIEPDNDAAWQSLERRLWTTEDWAALAETLQARLAHVDAAAERVAARTAAPDAPARPSRSAERERLLEELVAVHRDLLDDPAAALPFQDRLLGELVSGDAGERSAATTRAWVRRLDLAWRLHGPRTAPDARTVETFRVLAEEAGSAKLAAVFRVAAARAASAAGDEATARALFAAAAPDDASGAAVAGLERLAAESVPGAGDGGPAAAELRAGLVRDELARVEEHADLASGGDTAVPTRVRSLRFRLAWHALGAGQAEAALAALAPLRAHADPVAQAWSWEIARRSDDPTLALAVLSPDAGADSGTGAGSREAPGSGGPGLSARVDLAEARERAGDLKGAEAAFRHAHQQEPSADASLGLLRVAIAREDGATVLEATRALGPLVDARTARMLSREVALLTLLQPPAAAPGGPAPPPAADRASPAAGAGSDGADAPIDLVLGWMNATRAGDTVGAAAGLLGLGRALSSEGTAGVDLALDRMGLLARAAARSRLGGATLAGAVHDQVQALSSGVAPIGVGLADLPIAGRPERAAARGARAERNGGAVAYELELERGLDAEARGDGRGALEGFARALRRDADGIEALDGIKRVARAAGDLPGAARAGMRLGMVLRVPARAAAELGMAAQVWEDLGRPEEAIATYWQALARDPRSAWLFERLRGLLLRRRDWTGLDNLYGHRVAAVGERHTRVGLLFERAEHRLRRRDDRKAAIEDLKRILKIDPDHPATLRLLATLATEMEYFRQAVRFLDRLLEQSRDEEQAAALRLELAEAHESAREPSRAVEVLRQAVSARARDPVPWQRLIDLLLRLGDWQAALATLRSWDAVLAAPVPKAAVWMRIGGLLRDHARDSAGAAAAFTTAAELDPLGDGVRALVELHEQAGATAAREETLARGIAAMRAALAKDPLDVPRLRRLRELYQWSAATGSGGEGGAVVSQVLALAGEDVDAPATRRGDSRKPLPDAFWARLQVRGDQLADSLWPLLASAVGELWPLPKARVSARERVTPGGEPRLAWVESAASAVGVEGLELALAKPGSPGGDAGDVSVMLVEGNHPTLVVGRGLLAGDAAARFRIGRALGLLRDRAGVLERLDAAAVAEVFAAAAVVAGAPRGALPPAVEERARALGKAMSRKERKALELEAARFASEAIDAAAFRTAVLGRADRLGLLFAGDVAVAVRLAAEARRDGNDGPAPGALAREPRALSLLRFALSEDHLTARREIGQGRIDGG